jgi:hypothetical protein
MIDTPKESPIFGSCSKATWPWATSPSYPNDHNYLYGVSITDACLGMGEKRRLSSKRQAVKTYRPRTRRIDSFPPPRPGPRINAPHPILAHHQSSITPRVHSMTCRSLAVGPYPVAAVDPRFPSSR